MVKKKIRKAGRGQELKKKKVEEIKKLFDKYNSVNIASIKSLPSRQFHAIKKEIRDKAEVMVFKKSTISRALEASEKKGLQELKNYVKEDIAFLFSMLDPFELSAILSEKKSPIKAKVGQVAEEEIVIEPGPTEFTPGPVISELGALGIKIAIEEGKISIKERKVIVKKGEAISSNAAAMMAKLDIKPFSVGYIPLVAYDKTQDKIYADIKVDKELALKELKERYTRALAFAVKISYICKETIKHLLGKALSHEKAIEKLIKQDAKPAEQTIQASPAENPAPQAQINIQGGQS